VTVIRAHRVGAVPRRPQRPPDAGLVFLGPNLPLAACKGAPVSLWDATLAGEMSYDRETRHEQAKAICRTCPEMAACLRARLTTPELGEGIYGAQLFGPAKSCPCGAGLDGGDPKQRYCSRPCKDRAAMQRKPKAPVRLVVCAGAGCDVTFHTVQPQQRYHSKRCRKAQQLHRAREREVAA
jgi:hypothetical protein